MQQQQQQHSSVCVVETHKYLLELQWRVWNTNDLIGGQLDYCCVDVRRWQLLVDYFLI